MEEEGWVGDVEVMGCSMELLGGLVDAAAVGAEVAVERGNGTRGGAPEGGDCNGLRALLNAANGSYGMLAPPGAPGGGTCPCMLPLWNGRLGAFCIAGGNWEPGAGRGARGT
jgi:hypothetical protein